MDRVLFDFATYDRFLIKGHPFIAGNPNFQLKPIGSLIPGTKVHKIGTPGRNGKVTSSNQIDTWNPWVEYMGAVYVNLFDEGGIGDRCAAFRLPPGGLVDRSTGQPDTRDVFALYVWPDEGQLIKPNFNQMSTKVFTLVFTLPDNTIIK